MSVFVTRIKGSTSMGRTDLNKVAENILIPLLSEVYNYTNLNNLNVTEKDNYPAIDLGDEVARVAIQVTSTSDSKKIKETLRKFVEHKLYEKFDRLVIYILSERQNKYSSRSYHNIVKSKFDFDINRDVIDYQNLLNKISNFQVDKLDRIKNVLESNFGIAKVPFIYISEKESNRLEKVSLNLLETFFPENLYIADLDIDREETINRSRDYKFKLKKKSSTRNVARAALEQQGLSFGTDWICYEGKIVTFHNLEDDIPLAEIIDKGTRTLLSTKEFYEIDSNYKNIFKSLLGRCLQQKLYHQGVLWQNKAKLYIFSELDGKRKRTEQWYGKKKSIRTVYERIMKNNKPDEILHCKHLAFHTSYRRFGDNWYISIVPDWFFSFDGYRRSFYSKKNLDWLKKEENNKGVFNQLRFIVDFLKREEQLKIFNHEYSYPFLSFGKLATFENSLSIDDEEWNHKIIKNSQNELDNDDNKYKQLELFSGL